MTPSIGDIAIPLFAAHIIGDFILQRDQDVGRKRKVYILLKHSALVGILSYLFVGITSAWQIGALIFFTHTLIDYFKSIIHEKNLRVFTIDQAIHSGVIILISLLVTSRGFYSDPSLWLVYFGRGYYTAIVVISGAVLCTYVGGFFVGLGIKPYLDQLESSERDREAKTQDLSSFQARGLKDGGKIIGYLERALIYLFVLVDQPSSIGFLIAAKSVFRFGEVRERQNRMEAEYIIIGTMFSFLFGLVVSFLIKQLLGLI